MKKIFTPAFLSAVEIFAVTCAFFSYAVSTYWIYGCIAGLITLIVSIIISKLPRGKNMVSCLSAVILIAVPILLFGSDLIGSLLVFVKPFARELADPYNLRITLPDAPAGASAYGAIVTFMLWMAALGILEAEFRPMRLLSLFLTIPLTLFGFYYGKSPALIPLVLCIASWLVRPLTLRRSVKYKKEAPFAFISALGTALFLTLLVPAHSYQEPDILTRLSSEIISLTDPYDPIFHAGTAYSGMVRGTDGKSSLGHTDGVHYTGETLVHISTEDVQHRLYLRSEVSGTYIPVKNQWDVLPDKDYEGVTSLFNSNQGEWYDQGAWLMEVIKQNENLADGLAEYAPEAAKVTSLMHVFRVDDVYIPTKHFFIPYDLSFAMKDTFHYDQSPVSEGGKAYESYLWGIPDGAMISYLHTNRSEDPYLLTYENAESKYRDFVYSHYLTVPDGLLDNLKDLPIKKATTLKEKRDWYMTVKDYLETHYAYDTMPGATPSGSDFIADFLYRKKRGYCTAFASAGVMMLRAAGIPARYVVGISVSPDEINSSGVTNGFHELDINDYHAHAWAEVYVDGIGWRPAEMTPGMDGSQNPFPVPPDEKELPPDKNPNPNQPENQKPQEQQKPQNKQDNKPQMNENQQPQNQEPRGNHSTSPLLYFLLGLIVLLILAAGGVWFYIRRRMSVIPDLLQRFADHGRTEDFKALSHYMRKLVSYAGHPASGTTYRDWAHDVSRDSRFHEMNSWLSLYIKLRYSGKTSERDARKKLAHLTEIMRNRVLNGLKGKEKFFFLMKGL